MQSLILATSILLGSHSPVAVVADQESVDQFVQTELARVSKVVQYHNQLAAQDTFLYQSKLVIGQAKKEMAEANANVVTAE
mgnify:CR=1 FL=1